MNHDQMIAWLTLEGWELRRNPEAYGPTFVNIDKGVWFSHWDYEVKPLPLYPAPLFAGHCISTRPAGKWKDLQEEYLEQFIKRVVNQGESE